MKPNHISKSLVEKLLCLSHDKMIGGVVFVYINSLPAATDTKQKAQRVEEEVLIDIVSRQ